MTFSSFTICCLASSLRSVNLGMPRIPPASCFLRADISCLCWAMVSFAESTTRFNSSTSALRSRRSFGVFSSPFPLPSSSDGGLSPSVRAYARSLTTLCSSLSLAAWSMSISARSSPWVSLGRDSCCSSSPTLPSSFSERALVPSLLSTASENCSSRVVPVPGVDSSIESHRPGIRFDCAGTTGGSSGPGGVGVLLLGAGSWLPPE